MLRWKIGSAIKYGAHAVEKRLDAVKRGGKRRLNRFDPAEIMPYYGYGNDRRWHIKGRVIEELGIAEPSPEATAWSNARSMARRFTADEFPFVRLRARFGNRSWDAKTDDEGYFDLTIEPEEFDSEELWHPVQLELLDEVVKGQGPVGAVAQVSVPPRDAEFGVISDIDDTVLHSHATDLFRLIRMTFVQNSRSRVALPAVPAFYRALQRGPDGQSQNPFFYVSSSAWNLFDLLDDFLEHNRIPRGPILLRDLGIDKTKFIKTGHEHKLEKIRRIFETCAPLSFVLIGDAGQRDPQLYAQVVEEFPGRVKAIYIREVGWRQTGWEIERAAQRLKQRDVELLLVPDSESAAEHALRSGLISREGLGQVRQEQAGSHAPVRR